MHPKLAANIFFNGSGHGTGAIVDFTALPQAGQIVVTLFMVLNDNHGNPFPMSLLQQALNKLIVGFGGATVLAPGIGYWLSEDGPWFEDRVSPVYVVIPREAEAIHRLKAIVVKWARDLKQHEIFVHAQPAYQPLDMLAMNGAVLWQRPVETDSEAEPDSVPE